MSTKRRRTTLTGILCFSGLIAAGTLPVLAGPVKIGDHTIFSLRSSDAVQENLDNALVNSSNLSSSSVHVVSTKAGSIITLAGHKIVTINPALAREAKTTPPVLSKRWSDALRRELSNKTEVDNYIAQLNGGADNSASDQTAEAPQTAPPVARVPAQTSVAVNAPPQQPANAGSQPPLQGRVVYAPAGLTLPVTLSTALSSQVAQPGDLVEGSINQNIGLGNGMIPAGSTVSGQVTDVEAGRRLDRSGELSVKFNTLRLPSGAEAPLNAHIIGGIGKYAIKAEGSDTVHGETAKNKVESAAIRSALGAGTGAALGTAVGAIAGHGHGAGRGAWSGAAIGGGVGLADSLLLRKAADVSIKAGTRIELQLDAPVQIVQ